MINDGQRLLNALRQSGFEVAAAFWAKAGDDARWYLYLATPLVNQVGSTETYLRVDSVIRQLQAQPFWVDPFQIKVISPQSPMAEAVAKLSSGYAGLFRSGATQLGGETVEGAIIYPAAPPLVAATSAEETET
jgi:hypothetical protein